MPPAVDEILAARVVFGTPKDARAEELMRAWLNAETRDWRFESGEQPAQDRVVAVSLVLAAPKRAQNFRQILAMNVKRWGFFRKAHGRDFLVPMSVDQYMDGGIGNLVRGRVRSLLSTAVDKFEKANEERAKRLEQKLAAFRAKQRQRHLPVLKRCLKSLWDVASNEVRKKLAGKPFREDPVARRRRMTRGVDYDRLDEYTEEGEPDFAVQDRKRKLRVTVEV
jgi:hypothetical protein